MEITGTSVSQGIAIGKIAFYKAEKSIATQDFVQDTKAEKERFRTAILTAKDELECVYNKMQKENGSFLAQIFEGQRLLLEDVEYNAIVESLIEEKAVNAEFAIQEAKKKYEKQFLEMDDEYIKARVMDIVDISNRLINVLSRQSALDFSLEEPVILFALDLTPSEAVRIDRSKLLGLVTEHGSTNSHTAILARTMGIPAITKVKPLSCMEGKMAILDGKKGKLIIEPDSALIEEYKIKEKSKDEDHLLQLRGEKTMTKNGKRIRLFANIGCLTDLDLVEENDAEGIGLFRTEFLFLERDDFPTEEEQFLVYKEVAKRLGDKKVIIRTMDLGADKQVSSLKIQKEENPALGYRGIRICLEQTDIFLTQLRAILRASIFGNIAVMFPMIISLEEVKQIKELVEKAKKSLDDKGIAYKEIELGIMIETPAAALLSDELAKEVDFLSIGTNDLTQYTLAIDRQNEKLDRYYDVYHPAVLRLIEHTIKNGHKNGCAVGICGELGADLSMTKTLLQMGVDEFSVSPSAILSVRERICTSDVS